MNELRDELMNQLIQEMHGILNIHNPGSAISNYYEINTTIMISLITSHLTEPDPELIYAAFAPSYSYNTILNSSLLISNKTVMHQQNFFNLIYVLEGTMYQIIEGNRIPYTSGSCCLLNRNTRHTEDFSTDFRYVSLLLSSDIVERINNYGNSYLFKEEKGNSSKLIVDFFNSNRNIEKENRKDYFDFIPVLTEKEQKEFLHSLFEQMIMILLNPEYGSTFQLIGLLCKLINILSNREYYHSTYVQMDSNADSLLFSRISHLLEDTNGRLSRSELEQLLNYDGAYMSRVVKKYSGMSLFDYGMTFCLSTAENMLKNTSKSVSDIVSELQFTNRTHFYKLFEEKYGMTPSQYRKSR